MSMPLTTGNTLHHGKYLINHVVGQTDIGVTLQATQVLLNRSVILQVLQPNSDLGVDLTQLKQRFFEQIHRFAQCHHPGLVRLTDSFEEENAAISVLDYTAGQTLLEVVHANGALTESQAIQYIQQVGSALAELHAKGLIHRSVTPKNVIRPIGSNIVVLVNIELLDAAMLGVAAANPLPVEEYAAIEQYQAELSHTPATDIYALAGTLYFLLTGYAPLAAPLRHRSPLPSPRQLCPQLTSAVESAILHGLELNANSRPQAIAEWLALLPLPVISTDRNSNVDSDISSGSQSAIVASEHSPVPMTSDLPPTKHFSSQSERSMATSTLMLKNTFPKTLLTVAAIASAIGLGAGLTLRIAANSTGAGTSIFHSEQAFPPFENWPGAAPLIAPDASYSPSVVETPKKQQEPERTQFEAPAIVQPSAQEGANTKPPVEDSVPSGLSPQVPEANPTPSPIAPIPNSQNPELEPPPPPAVIPPQAPAEVRQEPLPPASTGGAGSGEIQR